MKRIGFVNQDIMNIFNSTIISSNALKNMMYIGILIYGVYNIGIYFIGNMLLNKGVDVD